VRWSITGSRTRARTHIGLYMSYNATMQPDTTLDMFRVREQSITLVCVTVLLSIRVVKISNRLIVKIKKVVGC